jgi:fucose 4-O-acetylase-like acetyltransferase
MVFDADHSIRKLMVPISAFATMHIFFSCGLNLNMRVYEYAACTTIASISGIYAVIFISQWAEKSLPRAAKSTLQYLGRLSLINYIFHAYIQSKPHTLLAAIRTADDLSAYVVSFLLGIALPLLFHESLIRRAPLLRAAYPVK